MYMFTSKTKQFYAVQEQELFFFFFQQAKLLFSIRESSSECSMLLADSDSRTLYIKISNPPTANSLIEGHINWSTTPNYLGNSFSPTSFKTNFSAARVGVSEGRKNSKEIFHNFLRGITGQKKKKKLTTTLLN